jgi:3-oxocholest-4-en-26-oyl-CoA dehydrogenase alpha subunit
VVTSALNAEHGMDESGPAPLEETPGENRLYLGVYFEALERLEAWACAPMDGNGGGGSRPADDPIVRRRLARIAANVELAKMTPGPMGRIVGVELAIGDAVEMLDLVGPCGLLPRGVDGAVADGWFEYAHRFAQGTAIYGGTTDVHRNIIAEHFLGMPRSRPSSSGS